MSKFLAPFVLATAITAFATIEAAEKASSAPAPVAPGSSSAGSMPARPGAATSADRSSTGKQEVPATNAAPVAASGGSPSDMSATPEPAHQLDQRLPGGADGQPVKPPQSVQVPTPPGPLQGRGPQQSDPLNHPIPQEFKEGRVDRPSNIRGVNTIDPLDGRAINDASVWTYGVLADPAPATTVGSADVVQQSVYLSFSSEEHLRAFERADTETRKNLIESARMNRMAVTGQAKQ